MRTVLNNDAETVRFYENAIAAYARGEARLVVELDPAHMARFVRWMNREHVPYTVTKVGLDLGVALVAGSGMHAPRKSKGVNGKE